MDLNASATVCPPVTGSWFAERKPSMAMQLFSGKQYLQIDVANNFGLDKEDWDTRLDWFAQTEGDLEHLVKDAEEPALFYASVEAYRKAQRSEAIAYPIS